MSEYVNIRPLELTDDQKKFLKAVCAKVFPEHSYSINASGFVSLTKETWANPESFTMHWYELATTVLPTYTIERYMRKYFAESCLSVPKNSKDIRVHPLVYMQTRYKV